LSYIGNYVGYGIEHCLVCKEATSCQLAGSLFEIGFDWVCFGFVFAEPEGVVYFHKPLSNRSLSSFDFFGNWVCFA